MFDPYTTTVFSGTPGFKQVLAKGGISVEVVPEDTDELGFGGDVLAELEVVPDVEETVLKLEVGGVTDPVVELVL